MAASTFHRPQRAAAIWVFALCTVAAGIAVLNLHLASVAGDQRRNDPRAFLLRADALMKHGLQSEAIAEARKAIALAPRLPDAHRVLGHIYFNFERWDDAEAAYKQALAFGSRDRGVRANLLWALIRLGKYEEAALTYGVPWIERGENTPAVLRYTAEAFVRLERWPEAAHALERVITVSPNDKYLLSQLERAYRNLGDNRRADEILDRLTRLETRENGR